MRAGAHRLPRCADLRPVGILDRSDAALVPDAPERREADREKREIKRQAKYAKDLAETQPLVDAAREALAADPSLFAGEAHPQIRGLTLRDKYEWMLANAGFDGRKATARVILRAAETKASNGAAV